MKLSLKWLPETAHLGSVLGIVLAGLVMADRDLRLTIEQTRPLMVAFLLALALYTGWHLRQGLAIWGAYRHKSTWMSSLKALGWQGFAASAIGILALLFASKGEAGWSNKTYAVLAVVPLILGLQMAFAFAAEDEPLLETALAYPRPISWLPLERLACALAIQSLIALLGVALTFWRVENLETLPTLIGWLPSAMFFSGLGMYITQSWRVAAFSAVMTGITWFLFLQFGGSLLPHSPLQPVPLNYIQPFLWGVNPFLHPGEVAMGDYWLNRGVVLLLGMTFMLLAVRYLRDSEEILMGLHGRTPSKSD